MEPETAWIGTWSPGFNDPTVMGWVITLAYFWVAWTCGKVAEVPAERGPLAVLVVSGARQISRAGAAGAAPLERRYFRALGWGLFILGINKQLDLQTAFFQLARAVTRSFEVESLKLALQIGFAVVLGACLLLLSGLLWLIARRLGRPARFATGGCLLLLAFVLVRALTFEALVDDSGLQLILFDSGVIEIGALAWIAFSVRLQRLRLPARGNNG